MSEAARFELLLPVGIGLLIAILIQLEEIHSEIELSNAIRAKVIATLTTGPRNEALDL